MSAGAFAQQPPPNDSFTNALLLVGAAGSTTGTTVHATLDSGEEWYTGTNSVWWRWVAPSDGIFTFETLGSSFDTVLEVLEGSALAELWDVARIAYVPNTNAIFVATNGVVYYIRVAGWLDASGEVSLHWHATPHPPNDAFTNAIAISGASGRSSSYLGGATVEPGEPQPATHTIWWAFNSTNTTRVGFSISTTDPSRVLQAFAGSSIPQLAPLEGKVTAGAFTGSPNSAVVYYYRVAVCVDAGQTIYLRLNGAPEGADVVFLDWSPLPPRNDNLLDSQAFRLEGSTGTTNASNCGATVQALEPPGANTVWFLWTALQNGLAYFDTQGSTFPTTLDVYAFGSYFQSLSHVGSESPGHGVEFSAYAGATYWIRVGSQSPADAGVFTVRWGLPFAPGPTNDLFIHASEIAGLAGSATGSLVNARSELGEPSLYRYSFFNNSIWWRWTSPADARIEFNTCGSSANTVLEAFSGAALDSLSLLDGNDNAGCPDGTPFSSRLLLNVTNGQTLYFRVSGWPEFDGGVMLNWQPLVTPLNDSFSNATVLSGMSGNVAALTYGATVEPNEPAPVLEHSIWWTWTCPASGLYHFDASPADSIDLRDVTLCAFAGTNFNALSAVACESQAGYSSVSFTAIEGRTFFFRAAGAETFLDLTWNRTAPALDGIEAASSLAGRVGSVSSNTLSGPGWTWWSWTAPSDMLVQFDTLGSDFDTILRAYLVYPEPTETNYVQIAYNDDVFDILASWESRIIFSAVAGTTYWIRLDGFASARGNFRLNWQCVPAALQAEIVGTNSVLTWPGGYLLQTATNLQAAPGAWTDVPAESGYTNNLGGTRFFRLICR